MSVMSPTDTVFGMLTVLFTAAAVHGLWQLVSSRSAGWSERVDHLLHTAMALAMAVMPWSWGRALPGPPQALFFTAAALWFPLTAAAGRPRGTWPGALPGRLPYAGGMAAMAWMTHSMAGSPHETLAGGPPVAHHAAAGRLPGESALGDAPGAVLALWLVTCALWSLTRDLPGLGGSRHTASDHTGVRAPGPVRHPCGHFWDGSMALGTAVMLLMPH
ncbi:DUF5134 domain-containing protein [Streptomyces sp. NPDC060275]|uniref:DUF5134 domain-containing protein n=1 Tax=Streptomyces sp. NPDC060275 TaxID=3347090 RepID=UPI00364696EC